MEIREQRAFHRAKRVALDEHFTPEELEALEMAFMRVDATESGAITVEDLPIAFSQVGMEVSDADMEVTLEHLKKSRDDSISFAEFAQAADFLSPVEQ